MPWLDLPGNIRLAGDTQKEVTWKAILFGLTERGEAAREAVRFVVETAWPVLIESDRQEIIAEIFGPNPVPNPKTIILSDYLTKQRAIMATEGTVIDLMSHLKAALSGSYLRATIVHAFDHLP